MSRLAQAVVIAVLLVLTLVAAGVPAAALTPLALILTTAAWASFVVLGNAAWHKPRIGALTERAVIALLIAVLGTVGSIIALNTDAGQPWFDRATAALLFRLSLLAILTVPTLWLILWVAGRLGRDGE